MNALQKITNFVLLYLVATFIFVIVALHALFVTINATTIKSVMKEKGVYAQVVPAVLATASYPKDQSSVGQIPLEEPWVNEVVTSAFTPQTVESLSTVIIDGSFDWLEGKNPSPEFSFDLSQNKQVLADKVGEYVTKRSANLPICTLADLQSLSTNINVYTAPCRPAMISPEQAGQSARVQVLSDQNFLKDPVIRSENLKEASGVSPFDSLKPLRVLYSNQGSLLLGFIILTVLFAIGGVLTARDHVNGLRRLFRLLLTAGISLSIFTFFIWLGSKRLSNSGSGEPILSKVMVPIIDGLAHKALASYVLIIVLIFAFASLTYAGYRYAKLKQTS